MLARKYRIWYVGKMLLLSGLLIMIGFVLFSGYQQDTVEQQPIVFVIDVSHSMNVKDVSVAGSDEKISRLSAVQQFIAKTVDTLPQPQSYGVIIFSQTANYFIPPTMDTETITSYVDSMTTNQLPFGGTNLHAALESFVENATLKSTAILLSDMGDDIEVSSDEWDDLQSSLAEHRLYMIALGTADGGVVITPDGQQVRENNQSVISVRNDEYVQQLGKQLDAKIIYVSSYAAFDHTIDTLQHADDRLLSQKQLQWLFPLISIGILFVL